MEKKIIRTFDEICINLQNTWRKKLFEHLMRFASIYKTHREKKLLEDLMRFASIYKTHGEKNCLKI